MTQKCQPSTASMESDFQSLRCWVKRNRLGTAFCRVAGDEAKLLTVGTALAGGLAGLVWS